MSIFTKLLIAYFISISILSALLTIYDKLASKNGKWRIPETTLIIIGLLGGALFMYVTMKLIRHKTLHKKFMIGLPAEIIIQVKIVTGAIYLVIS